MLSRNIVSKFTYNCQQVLPVRIVAKAQLRPVGSVSLFLQYYVCVLVWCRFAYYALDVLRSVPCWKYYTWLCSAGHIVVVSNSKGANVVQQMQTMSLLFVPSIPLIQVFLDARLIDSLSYPIAYSSRHLNFPL